MNKLKKILRILSWVFLVVGTFSITGFINHNAGEQKCSEVLIDIRDSKSFGFIDEGEIMDLLNSKFQTPISQKIRDINTYEIEKLLNEHQAIDRADVYISIDGKLVVTLRQRRPILRVFSRKGSFYIDEKGVPMPTSNKYTAHVPVASGEINLDPDQLKNITEDAITERDSNVVPALYFSLYDLSAFIDASPFWEAQIEQVYVDKQSEFELIPRVGNHTIVFGEVYNLESKFTKLKRFYDKGLSKTGWNEYKTINLKFENQVVCTKRY